MFIVYLKVQFLWLVKAIIWEFFNLEGIFFQNFRPSKCKSSSSGIISYPRLMKIKVRYKSGVVAMNFRGKSKGSFENHRDVSSIVSNFM